ncbi:hypothetical protein SBOR_7640 [Sclerotinia borealis F-4128]|uniref:Uncharacterized protein n=1 Tax=Sclerotinia borealis (strain F-4128) TaxID=1432307 RepID=W9C864_SCLBF|nr:hypothetical protein SBOR_7640 [Sclerotinia borealis F-4128]
MIKSVSKYILVYISVSVPVSEFTSNCSSFKHPALLSVCRVARERGLKKYQVLTVQNSWKRDKKMYDERNEEVERLGHGLTNPFIGPEAATTNFKCYINYDWDTVFINTTHSRIYDDALPDGAETWREDVGYQFLKDLYFSPAGDQIQSLAIDYSVAAKWLDTGRNNWKYCQVLAAMPQLSKLAVAWTDYQGLEGILEKECCDVEIVSVEPGRKLTNEERYCPKFPCGDYHRHVKKFKAMGSLAPNFEETSPGEQFASGKTSTTWKKNIMAAIRERRPRNPADHAPDSFHFIEGGKSRYRDLDDLELSQVHIEREKK